MFHVNNQQQLREELTRDSQGWNGDDLVWRGDDGSYILATPGEFEAQADEDDEALYALGGTVAEFRHDMGIN